MTDSITPLHYAANGNYVNGRYAPGVDGFNLADVSSRSVLDSFAANVKGLVYVGMTDGVTAGFKSLVNAFLGDSKVFGFYLADEPSASPTIAANLKAESAYIHQHFVGAKTFMVEQNFSGPYTPSFYYKPANTGIDLFGLDPYPIRSDLPNHQDYRVIAAAVAAARRQGIPLADIVPVYQAFGGGGGPWITPTGFQERQILAVWGYYAPRPAFDYAYTWGTQGQYTAISNDLALQKVFAIHNHLTAASAMTASTGLAAVNLASTLVSSPYDGVRGHDPQVFAHSEGLTRDAWRGEDFSLAARDAFAF